MIHPMESLGRWYVADKEVHEATKRNIARPGRGNGVPDDLYQRIHDSMTPQEARRKGWIVTGVTTLALTASAVVLGSIGHDIQADGVRRQQQEQVPVQETTTIPSPPATVK